MKKINRKTQNKLVKKQLSNKKGRVQPRLPQWWKQEFKGTSGVGICPHCTAVYFDKHWHNISALYNKLKGDLTIFRSECDACKQIRNNVYEGKVTLSGFKDELQKGEIIKLIKNISKRATNRDPEDRIIKIEDQGKKVIVTTTENQLAFSIGKQVDKAFKGGDVEYHWSEKDHPLRVYWKYK